MAAKDKTADQELRFLSGYTLNGVSIPAGRVAKVPGAVVKALVKDGVADDTPEAVTYALTENAEVIDATPAPEPAGSAEPAAAPDAAAPAAAAPDAAPSTDTPTESAPDAPPA